MKKTVLVLALLALFSIGAFAATQTLTLSSPHTLNGQTLAAGSYDVKTTISGTSAEVIWSRNGKKVATATGQVVQSERKADNDGVESEKNASGEDTVKALQYRGKNTVVRFDSTGTVNGK